MTSRWSPRWQPAPTSCPQRWRSVRLKQQEGGDLLIFGHGLLGETLLRARLTDVIDLSVYPVLAGSGKQFFRDGQAAKLRLAAVKTFSNIVKMTYEPQH